MGPRKGVFFLFAKTRPVEEGREGKADSLYRLLLVTEDGGGGGARTRRMFKGNVVVAVGVEGRTFTEVCGERPVVFEA